MHRKSLGIPSEQLFIESSDLGHMGGWVGGWVGSGGSDLTFGIIGKVKELTAYVRKTHVLGGIASLLLRKSNGLGTNG